MSDYGFRISKNGVDVKTGADKDMIVTSKYPLLKGSLFGNGSVVVTSGTITTITITHNLGYIPFAMGYFADDLSNVWYFMPFYAGGGVDWISVFVKANTTSIIITIDWYEYGATTRTFYYKYFIFLDKGKL